MVVAIGILLPDLIQTIISVFVAVPDVGFGKLVGGISFNLLIYLGIAGKTRLNRKVFQFYGLSNRL
jgi:Ca2+/Na+ antiporter